MDNLVEPVTKELDFQLQTPFLLYRNHAGDIYGIWFYEQVGGWVAGSGAYIEYYRLSVREWGRGLNCL